MLRGLKGALRRAGLAGKSPLLWLVAAALSASH
jgi:hypothetical protein